VASEDAATLLIPHPSLLRS